MPLDAPRNRSPRTPPDGTPLLAERDRSPRGRDTDPFRHASPHGSAWQAACSGPHMPSVDAVPGADTRRRTAAERAERARLLAAHGLSNKDIAAELGVAESTISRLTRTVGLPSMARAEEALRAFAVLTASERAVLAMAASGSSADVIANARGTSPRTIANQLRSAYDKLGVGSRRELRALIGADNG